MYNTILDWRRLRRVCGTWYHRARACRDRFARDLDTVRVADRKASAVVLDGGILHCVRSIKAEK